MAWAKQKARLFAAEGAKVNVADILETEAQRVAANIRASGGEAMAAKIEVTSEPEWRALIAETGGVSPLSCRGVSSLYCAYIPLSNNRPSGKSAAGSPRWVVGAAGGLPRFRVRHF